MHRLLARQIKRFFGEGFKAPEGWNAFLEAVDEAYRTSDSHREMLERSLVLSTEEVHQANAEMRAIFQAIPDLLFRVQHDGTILDLKTGSEADLILAPRALIRRKLQGIPDPKVADAFRNCLERVVAQRAMCHFEYSLSIKGHENFYEARLVPFLQDQVVVLIQNITTRKKTETIIQERTNELQRINRQLQDEIQRRFAIEERLRHEASHDRLTGLPNRGMLMERMEHCLQFAKRHTAYQFALLFIDLDDFKVVNDTLGHHAGDALLTGIAQRLSKSVRAIDVASRPSIASRFGGDEFVVLLEGISGAEDAMAVAHRIEKLMEDPFLIEGHKLTITMSIGVAFGPSDYAQATDILRDADAAVYFAKHAGKQRCAAFEPGMRSNPAHHPAEEP